MELAKEQILLLRLNENQHPAAGQLSLKDQRSEKMFKEVVQITTAEVTVIAEMKVKPELENKFPVH